MLNQALLCMAINVFFEAKGESNRGMEAVAQVTMNRAEHKSANVCSVVFAPKQFSWTTPYIKRKHTNPITIAKQIKAKDKKWIQAKLIAKRALSGKLENIVGDATYFYNPRKARPIWRFTMAHVVHVGNHRFMKPKERKET